MVCSRVKQRQVRNSVARTFLMMNPVKISSWKERGGYATLGVVHAAVLI
jgi:hypothetical protein